MIEYICIFISLLQGRPFVFGPTGESISRAYFRVATDGNVYVNFPLTTSTTNDFEVSVINAYIR